MASSPIRIITDSTASLPRSYVEENGIVIVPLTFLLEDELYTEGFPDSYPPIYQRIKASGDIPRSSQPSVGAFAEAFTEARDAGLEVVAPIITSGVSGTYQSACIAAEMVDPGAITVIDTKLGGSAMHFIIESALEAIAQGRARVEVAKSILSVMRRTTYDFTVATLEYLKRGGRLSNLQAAVGSLLNLRPHIRLVDGAMVAIDRLRGQSRVVESMIRQIPTHACKISVCHVLNSETAAVLRERLSKLFPSAQVRVDEMGPVIGGNLGPGALGIAYMVGE